MFIANKKRKSLLETNFYKCQIKDYKRQKLDELRKGFEEDKAKLEALKKKKLKRKIK